MRITPFIAALAAAAPALALAQSGGPAMRNLAAPCAICHGTDGHSVTKEVTTLAGIPADHIAAQMRAFRDGKRAATVMHQIAKGYTDREIDALATWFAAQKR